MSQTTVVKYIVLMQDQLSPGLKRQAAALGGVNTQLAKTNAQMGAMKTKTKGLTGNIGGMAKSFLPLIGVMGTIKLLSESVKGWDRQVKAIAQVRQGIISTNQAAGKTLEMLKKEAADLQENTLFGDEEILAGATAQLLTFTNIANKEFSRTQKVVLDVATRLAAASDGTIDLKATSLQLGKALNDPVKNLSALSRSGIQFTDQQKKMIKALWEGGRQAEAQRVILSELEKQYGGSAEAAAKAGTGPLKQLKNTIGDVFEDIGSVIGPALNKASKFLKKFFDSARKNFHKIKTALRPVSLQFQKMRDAVKKLFEAIFRSNDATATASDRWAKLAEILRLTYAPLRGITFIIRKLIDWVRLGVEWFQKWKEKSEGLRRIINLLLDPFKQLMKAFEWINRQIDQADQMDRLETIRQNLDNLRDQLSAPFITFAKRDDIRNQIAMLKTEANKILGKENVFKWTIKTQKDGIGGEFFDSILDPILDPSISNKTEITGATPKIFNIQVGSLVEEIIIKTETFKESKEEVKQTIVAALTEGLADFQINAG